MANTELREALSLGKPHYQTRQSHWECMHIIKYVHCVQLSEITPCSGRRTQVVGWHHECTLCNSDSQAPHIKWHMNQIL